MCISFVVVVVIIICVLAFHFGYKIRNRTVYIEGNGRVFPFWSRQGLGVEIEGRQCTTISYELQNFPLSLRATQAADLHTSESPHISSPEPSSGVIKEKRSLRKLRWNDEHGTKILPYTNTCCSTLKEALTRALQKNPSQKCTTRTIMSR